MLEQAQKNAAKIERPPLPDEIDVNKLHAIGTYNPMRVVTPEMIKVAAAKRRAATAKYRAEQKRRIIFDRLAMLARDCGPRLLDPETLKQSEYDVYDKAQSALLTEIDSYIAEIDQRVGRGDGIVLIGKPGTGKDHLCIRVARLAIIDADADVRWIDGKALYPLALDAVRGGTDRMPQFIMPKILILSDPVTPKENLSPYQHDALSRIINERWLHKRPTFVTSNCKTLEEMESLIDSRLMSRLKQGALIWKCTWPDYRERA